jgi:hypothetical protein
MRTRPFAQPRGEINTRGIQRGKETDEKGCADDSERVKRQSITVWSGSQGSTTIHTDKMEKERSAPPGNPKRRQAAGDRQSQGLDEIQPHQGSAACAHGVSDQRLLPLLNRSNDGESSDV